jgi:hypothetical protein
MLTSVVSTRMTSFSGPTSSGPVFGCLPVQSERGSRWAGWRRSAPEVGHDLDGADGAEFGRHGEHGFEHELTGLKSEARKEIGAMESFS